MHNFTACLPLAALLATAPAAMGAPPIEPVPYRHVTIEGDFWRPRLAALRAGTLEANRRQCDITGRMANFDRAAKGEGEFQGLLFNDSDVYKVVEGWSCLVATAPDAARRAELDSALDGWIARIAAAQQSDGYINTYYTLKAGLANRLTREEHDHETYCIGHLIEAGVAHFQATGKRTLLDVAVRAADYLDGLYGPGRFSVPPGHEELELALVRLAAATGQARYFDLAGFLIEQRGRPHRRLDGAMEGPWGDYAQDHQPAADQRQAAGHAVRAGYLYCAMADLARAGRGPYTPALDAIWDDITQRRIFVTGGIGPSGRNEGFTTPFDIPTASAYQETCASIALCMWAHRMFLLHGDARYMDQFERTLYNAVLAGVSLDGSQFFYVNPLASRTGHRRQAWFSCACCPPNVLRFLASLGGCAYAVQGDSVFINLFAQGEAQVSVAGGSLHVRQATDYPASGIIEFEFTVEATRGPVDVAIRIPAWSGPERTLTVDGAPAACEPDAHGYVHVTVSKQARVRLNMTNLVQRVRADPRVTSARGRFAVMAGPLVYCFEAVDTEGGLARVFVPPGQPFEPAYDDKMQPRRGPGGELLYAAAGRRVVGEGQGTGLYRQAPRTEPVGIVAAPYYQWANRARGAMLVWMPESDEFTDPAPAPGIKASASHTGNGDGAAALFDRITPESSGDHSIPRFTFWNHKGTQEWVRYDFDAPRTIGSTEVYWFDDTGAGECRVPDAWSIEHLDGDQWKPVTGAGPCGVAPDTFNRVAFDPVTTTAVRLRITLREKFSAGILEWKVGPDK